MVRKGGEHHENQNRRNRRGYGSDMLSFMKEMHLNFNDFELEQMYNNCHQREGNANAQVMMPNNSMMERVTTDSI